LEQAVNATVQRYSCLRQGNQDVGLTWIKAIGAAIEAIGRGLQPRRLQHQGVSLEQWMDSMEQVLQQNE
jgi:hypothetical protein